jgi:hypothetical protein
MLYATIALASFGPKIRIDHDDKPTNRMVIPKITLGPRTSSSQPLYVAFEDDSGPFVLYRSDIMFQKSTDAGRTWLPADVLVHRGRPFATHPDITTDSEGNIYVVYTEKDTAGQHAYCVRSSDGGSTWAASAKVDDHTSGGLGGALIAADSAGNLFCAWNAGPLDNMHIFSSVSTDKGATWSARVRVCRDSLYPASCANPDVFVQPGTNHYFVAASATFDNGSYWTSRTYLYRSTDMGRTFQPGAPLDTCEQSGGSTEPHVVADGQHVICDYTTHLSAEARTLYTQPDTWGSPSLVSRLDSSQYRTFAQGGKLAISADGCVHTALMVLCDTIDGIYLPFYVYSSDHGVTWSELELANDDTTADSWDPDIGVDSAGHAYIVWQNNPGERGEICFATNHPVGIADQPPQQSAGVRPLVTFVRGVLVLGAVGSRQNTAYRAAPSDGGRCGQLLDAAGRKVADLQPGANDVRALAPGIYFVMEAQAQAQAIRAKPSAVTKVVIAR